MGIFNSNSSEIKRLWKSINDYQRDFDKLTERILRLEHPPKFKNLQEIYICEYPCGGKPIKRKAVVIKSIFHYSNYERHTDSPPSYSYEISIEGLDHTIIATDENFEPRTK